MLVILSAISINKTLFTQVFINLEFKGKKESFICFSLKLKDFSKISKMKEHKFSFQFLSFV